MGKIHHTIQQIVIAPIILYQILIRPVIGAHCRFYPCCSDYAKMAIRKKGIFLGIWIALKRIVSCRPGNPGGYHWGELGEDSKDHT